MKRFSRPLLIVVCFTLLAYLTSYTALAGNRPLGDRFSPARVMEALAHLNPLRVLADAPPTPRRMPDAISQSETRSETKKPRVLLAQAPTTFVVTVTGDGADPIVGDGVCESDYTTTGSQCTLRAAIQEANFATGANTINFNIPGGGVQTISPTSALPTIGDQVTINGYTQTGAATNSNISGALNTTLTVVLDGTSAGGGVSGLTINGASNCAIRGLNIRNFASSGIVITNTSTSNTIAGCFIGTNETGATVAGNGGSGVQLSSVIGNAIGGLAASDRNLISGNTGTGILDLGDGTATATGNTIQGNVIGLNAATTLKRANNIGIEINSRDSTTVGSPATGGILTGASNIISGNTNEGVSVINFIAGNDNISIRGNDIGTNGSNASGLGNGASGVFIGGVGDQIRSNTIIGNGGEGILLQNATGVIIQQNNIGFATNGNAGSGVFLSNGAKNTIIGGAVGDSFATAEGNGNLIAGNLTGVSVDSGADDATGNSIRGNTIEQNTTLGINLNGNGASGDGVTPNDLDDPDTGDNLLQNSPVIDSIVGGNTVNYHLNSTPNTTFVVDFYDNSTASAFLAEGSAGLGSMTVTTDSNGDVQTAFAATTISGFVTAVATDPAGNTSEFSSGVRAAQTFTINTTASDDDGACNTLSAGLDCTLREAINAVNNGSGGDTIAFNIGGAAGVKTIAPTSPFPAITQPVTIDGYTQTGANANTAPTGNNATLLIELNGAAAGTTTNGLTFSADGITVRGLVINRFSANGISINQSAGSSGNTIAGCFLGTNAAGTADLGNGSGILLGGFNSAGNNTIGGTTPQARNVISGNGNGVEVINNDNTIAGNYIGLNAAGTTALGNSGQGIALFSPAITGNTIGGTTAASRNVISANAIGIRVTGDGTIIQGNFIGLDAAGSAARGNTTAGIQFNFFAPNTSVGGLATTTGAAPGNVISSNGVGIDCPSSAPATGSLIRGNLIGTDVGGTLNRGNTGAGIHIESSGVTVGGTAAGATNTIANNGGDGVEVATTPTGVSIQRNSIFANTGLGIDLNADGVTANDAGDPDPGPNNLQNFPVITAIAGNNIIGNINSTPNTNFTLEFFQTATADPSGNGEGQTLLTSQPIRTNAGGTANFSFAVAGAPTGFVTATATNTATGDTSEFSNAFRSLPTLSITDVTAPEGDTGTAITTFTVILSAASTQTITVDFATANNTAITPGDYNTQTGTLTFTPGQSAKTITVLVQGDLLDEANETYFVNLSNPTNATIADAQGVGTITDNDAAPSVTVNDVTVTEGNIGTTLATFTVTLSAVSGRNITVNYATADGTATSPSDYTTTNGALTIPAGQTTGTITVIVNGDTTVEPNETFFVNLTSATNATIADNQGIGTITNDDITGPTISSFTPTSGPRGSIVTITGTGFTGTNATTTVEFGGNNTTVFTIDSTTQITATVPATAVTGPIRVVVGGQQAISGTNFTVTPGYLVTNTNDTNAGSLREGINYASNLFGNNAGGPTNINFGIPGTGVKTITPASSLPAITQPVTINGFSQTGSSANTNATGALNTVLTVELNGAGAGATTNGFNFSGAGDNCTIRGLVINRFGGSGISADNSTVSETFAGNFIGTNAAGTTALPNGTGITLIGPHSNTTIGGITAAARNLISGNTTAGVTIGGTTNTVLGNLIGTNAACTSPLGNGDGVLISLGNTNTIGGTTTTARNVISGNNANGVQSNGTSNTILGNFIGTNATGTAAIANTLAGVRLSGSQGDIIGGNTASARNIISGNTEDGVRLTVNIGNTRGARIEGNFIGTDVNGTAALGNGRHGVNADGAVLTDIGSDARNVISGNTQSGIDIAGDSRGTYADNFIGVDATGNVALANSVGIFVHTTSGQQQIIGATGAANRNIISGNSNTGIIVRGATSIATIVNNYIGLGTNGTTDVGNTLNGVLIDSSSTDNTIGGTTAGEGNVISGNGGGVRIESAGITNTIAGNIIGLAADGTTIVGNDAYGVGIVNSASNTIGGSSVQLAGRNIISGNGDAGVDISGAASTGNIVQANFIGTDQTGTLDRGNGSDGVRITNASSNTVGSTSGAGGGALISGNGGDGIQISASAVGTASANSIIGNSIGFSSASSANALPNTGAGISIEDGAAGNIIGVGGFPNTIAHNTGAGVAVTALAGTGNQITRNSIFQNGGLGIDLGATGVTPNDNDDTDTGPNALQNFPVLTSVTVASGNTTIAGTLNSTPNTQFTLEFFSNPSPDPSGFGEGQTFVFSTTSVTTDASGNATFNFGITGTFTDPISATATPVTAPLNTSEFSRSIRAVQNFVVDTTSDSATMNACTAAAGDCSLRGAINNANARSGGDTISFAIPATQAVGGIFTVTTSFSFPDITKAVTINGFSQTGSSANTRTINLSVDAKPLIQITGAPLTVKAASTKLKGLIVNGSFGGVVLSVGANNCTITGCFIGTSETGANPSGAQSINGDCVTIDSTGNLIGGTTPAARNVIGASNGDAIRLNTGANTNTIQGNFLQVNAAGTITLAANGGGVSIASNNNLIGGTVPEARNVMSAGNGSGVSMVSGTGNKILRNSMGTTPAGTAGLPEPGATNSTPNNSGVTVLDGTTNRIGDGTAANGNLIAFNTNYGVTVLNTTLGGVPTNPTGISIRGNSIHDNGTATNPALGIDLVPSGGAFGTPNANDAGDADTGANNLQNFPVLSNVRLSSGNTLVDVSLDSLPGTYNLDFYSNAAADPSGNGEGQTFVGTDTITIPTGATNAAKTVTLTGNFTSRVLSATATDAAGNTSEFSVAVRNSPTLSITDVTAPEGDTGTAITTFTVILSAASTQTITFDFATANNTAIAPGDYNAQTGTLTFAPGQTAKTITVLVQGDLLDEANETYFVNLSNPTNATITDAQGQGTILDNDAPPVLSVADTSLIEPDTGTANLIFTVTLSAISGKTVRVDFLTQNGSATSPTDYAALPATTLTIPAGATSGTIAVPIIGDTAVEPDETFFVNLSNAVNATIGDNQAIGTIINNDVTSGSALVVDTISDANLTACTTNPNDCSLRGAINRANAAAGADTISFNIPGAGVKTIALASLLPNITEAVTINGYTQPGASVNNQTVGNNAILLVQLSGSTTIGRGFNVLASNVNISGLAINRFTGDGVILRGNSSQISGCFIGTNITGTGALPNGGTGVVVTGDNNRIGGAAASQRNLLSGNGFNGVHVQPGATGTIIQGNYVGTNVVGAADLGNASVGILIQANNNTIGGTTATARNVVSGNDVHGIDILGGTGNAVQGNYVGTNAAGSTDLGNTRTGIRLEGNATNNVVGGTTRSAGNLVSGNDGAGILLTDAGTLSNAVQGNFIGTNAAGLLPLPNPTGVLILTDAQLNNIGGTANGAGNLIAGNDLIGIEIRNADNNHIEGNTIGLSFNGAALSNGAFGDGIQINAGAKGNIVGGTVSGARNIISGNNGTGILINGSSANPVRGNYIGTNPAGNVAIANGRGVRLTNGATGNIIGGTTAAFRNIISGCEYGVAIEGAATVSNAILGNYLGTNAAGNAVLSNRFGVGIFGAARNTIGGTVSGSRNLISGNTDANIYISENAAANSVLGNFIGTTLNGAASFGAFSTTAGVWIDNGANSNVIGGNTVAARNVISGNAGNGVLISGRSFGLGALARTNRVTGNYVGLNATGNAKVANGNDGIAMETGALNNVVGTIGGGRNLVSGNNRYGISMSGTGTDGNTIQNNWVGLNATGNGVLGNVAQGIVMHDGAQRNRIGGDVAGTGNVVAGNTHNGIGIGGINGATSGQNTAFNVVQGNFVGTDPTGKLTGFGNLFPGIAIAQGAHDNLIGGTTSGTRNLISGNKSDGIFLGFPDARSNRIQGNYIGIKADGSGALPNNGNGITIADNARSNIVGGSGGRNIISGNSGAGIFISGTATANIIASNFIGTNIAGTAGIGNQFEGVQIRDAFGNLIGGSTTAARNIISGNGLIGVAGLAIIGDTAKNNSVQGNYIGTNATGTAAIPNTNEGVFVNAINNTIGGVTTTPGTGVGNLISGNNGVGVHMGTFFGGSSAGNRVMGNSIGLNVAGTAALPNFHGVTIDGGAQNNTIGGAVAGTRNVISGNIQRGVYITEAGTIGNRVEGNYVGTNLSGTGAIANKFVGITITFAASNNIIGGFTSVPGTGAGNLVSGNLISGISLEDKATNNSVFGNAVGVAANGTTSLPNRKGTQAGWGVLVVSASNNTVGNTTTGANLIANNDGPGIGVLTDRGSAFGNRFRGNRLFNNGGLGIDLIVSGFTDGVTANDSGAGEGASDADGGANHLQNYPVLTSATQSAAGQPLVLQGSLDSTSGRTFTIDAYSNAAADLSLFGEGQTYLGSFVIGNGTFNKSLAASGDLAGKLISLTATDNTTGDTSEFSKTLKVNPPITITVAVSPKAATLNSGDTQTFTATVGGTTNQNVTWKVDGGAAGGTITAAGLYTAPATPGTYTVRATSVADNTVSGTATVTVVSTPTGNPLLGWGYNEFGSVGDSSNTNRLSPVDVSIIQNARLLASGGSHNLAVAGNVLYAWGDNDDAQLGDGTHTSRNRPVAIPLPSGIRADSLKAITCGWYHSLALTSDGRVLAWGFNKDGQCGVQADAPRFITAPRLVAGLTNITQIAGGTLHSLALDSNGKVWAWGNNFYGQLGNGSVENLDATPTIVAGLPNAKAIGAGAGHSVALLTDGTAKAWGWNFYGQLGNGLSGYQTNGEERRSAVPVTVKNVSAGSQLSVGYAHTLVLKGDSTLLSWGNNFYGQLGRTTPNANDAIASGVANANGTLFGNVEKMAAGSGHNLVIRGDGTIWSWGYNEFGNLGLGNSNDQIAPQPVLNLTDGQAVAAGYAHSIAIASRVSARTPTTDNQPTTTLQNAISYASNNSIVLTFSAKLQSIGGGAVRVLVNGREIEAQSTSVSGNALTILLPKGTLKTGDEVIVSWSQLHTQAGESLIGNSPTIIVE